MSLAIHLDPRRRCPDAGSTAVVETRRRSKRLQKMAAEVPDSDATGCGEVLTLATPPALGAGDVDGDRGGADGAAGQPRAGDEAVIADGIEADAAPGAPRSGETPGPDVCEDQQTFDVVLNLGDDSIDSITSHRILYSQGKYTVELWAVARGAAAYETGWKTELELSWIAIDKVIAYWATFPGARDGGLCPAAPYLRFDRVLAVLGHRKKRYGRLQLRVLLQGTFPDLVWVEEPFMRSCGLYLSMDPGILDFYWEAVGSSTRFEGLQDAVPETRVDLVVETDGIALRPSGAATTPPLAASAPPRPLPLRVEQLRARGKGVLRPVPYGFPTELYSHLFRPA